MPVVVAVFIVIFGGPFLAQAEELAAPAPAETRLRWSAGAGLEGRLQQDVNPNFPSTRSLPQLFAQLHLGHWAAAFEFGFQEKMSSSSGAMSVESRSLQASLWGRYNFKKEIRGAPFVTAGLGAYFDTVNSRFGEETDTQTGRRDFLGFGGGLSHEIWRHVQLEFELRTGLIEDRKDIAVSGIFRLGFLL